MHCSSQTGRFLSIAVALAAAALASCAQLPQDDEPTAVTEDGLELAGTECLYVGDDVIGGTDRIQRIDPFTGAYRGQINPSPGALGSVRGLVFTDTRDSPRDLIAADQNAAMAGQPEIAGEILHYPRSNGVAEGTLVSAADPDAPWAPRGIIVHRGMLYVADAGDSANDAGDSGAKPGRIAMYDLATGYLRGYLDGGAFPGDLGPRALVVGPDGLLYVSVYSRTDPLVGRIVRFDLSNGELVDVFADEADCGCGLHRPEGLVFGPDGNLYVTAFRDTADPSSVNQILIFFAGTEHVGHIVLDNMPGNRVSAQALLFGPKGKLYVPVNLTVPSNPPIYAGAQLRVYDVADRSYTILTSGFLSGPVTRPFYLTFCSTNPATLAYEQRAGCACGNEILAATPM